MSRVKAEEQLRLARENNQIVHQNDVAGIASHIDACGAATEPGDAEVGFVAESLDAQLAAFRVLRAMGAFDDRKTSSPDAFPARGSPLVVSSPRKRGHSGFWPSSLRPNSFRVFEPCSDVVA